MNQTITTTLVAGASGVVGIEITAHLLHQGHKVIAIIRDEHKFAQLLHARGLQSDNPNLRIVLLDIFAEQADTDQQLQSIVKNCAYIVQGASPKISWNPFSATNRNWNNPVSNLTKKLVQYATDSNSSAHIFTISGSDYFKEIDGTSGPFFGLIGALFGFLSPAIKDNRIESRFLVQSPYKNWTVLRCGSIRKGTGKKGNYKHIGTDPHKDKSDYRAGKGKALVAEDLGDFVAHIITTHHAQTLKTSLPFVFNTHFAQHT